MEKKRYVIGVSNRSDWFYTVVRIKVMMKGYLNRNAITEKMQLAISELHRLKYN